MGIRKPKSRAEQTADNRLRLLEAARAVFLRHGYHTATLDQVARAAGLTKGAVYARFDSKAALFLALLDERVDLRVAELAALPPPRGADVAVEAVFQQWLERIRGDAAWSLLVIEFRVAAARERALNDRFAVIHERLVAAVAERIELGARAAGVELALPARDAARLGLSLANGILLERAAGERHMPEALAVRANRALFDAIATRPTPARGRKGAR